MKWTVDVRQIRSHDATGDQPTAFEATISVAKPTDTDPATLANYRDLLISAIQNLNIPATALLTDGTTLSIKWP
jgi:hypothetical protein